jgi:hypothetical protein
LWSVKADLLVNLSLTAHWQLDRILEKRKKKEMRMHSLFDMAEIRPPVQKPWRKTLQA